MRTAGRIFAGLFVGAVLFVGLGSAAYGQASPSPSPSPSPVSTSTTSTTARPASTTATSSAVGGSTLPHTGTDVGVPLAIGAGALVVTLALRRMLAAR